MSIHMLKGAPEINARPAKLVAAAIGTDPANNIGISLLFTEVITGNAFKPAPVLSILEAETLVATVTKTIAHVKAHGISAPPAPETKPTTPEAA